MNKPHHSGTYPKAARFVRDQAYANPQTRCWRCNLTIEEIHAEHPQAKWTAGHVVDGEIGGRLLAECSPCNYREGGKLRHAKRTELSW